MGGEGSSTEIEERQDRSSHFFNLPTLWDASRFGRMCMRRQMRSGAVVSCMTKQLQVYHPSNPKRKLLLNDM